MVEREFLKLSLENKERYENTPWWRFRKRYQFKKEWHRYRNALISYSEMNKRLLKKKWADYVIKNN